MCSRPITLFAALGIASLAFAQAPPIPAWTQWKGSDCRMTYPVDWRLDESGQQGSMVFFFSPVDSGDVFSENVNLSVQDLQGATPKEYVDLTREQVMGMLENAALITAELAPDGRSAEFEYTGSSQGAPLHFKQKAYFTPDKVYLVTYTAMQDMFEEYLYLADAIIESFQLKP